MFAWVTLGFSAPGVSVGSGSPGSRVTWFDEGVARGAPLGPAVKDALGASVARDSSSASVASGDGAGLAVGVTVAVAVAVAVGDGEAGGTGVGVVLVPSQPAATAAARSRPAISLMPLLVRMRNLRPWIRHSPCGSASKAYDAGRTLFGHSRNIPERPVGYDRPMSHDRVLPAWETRRRARDRAAR